MYKLLHRLALLVCKFKAWSYYLLWNSLQGSGYSTNKSPQFILTTIAFNNLDAIKLQHQNLKKYFLDSYIYVVIDNSTNDHISGQISKLCHKLKVIYLKVPYNPYNNVDSSYSHGFALNWATTQLGSLPTPKYYGFIDHDLFLLRPTYMSQIINHAAMYGLPQSRGEIWYLWPGYTWFRKDILKNSKLNFEPIPTTDSGGGNWRNIYSHYHEQDFKHPLFSYLKTPSSKTKVEQIDNWIHWGGASGWRSGGKTKKITSKTLSTYRQMLK